MTEYEKSQYDPWADVYDSVYSYVRDDIPFYLGEALSVEGAVLELGCGTGRVAIPIAQTGVDVVGIDNSQAMLDQAQIKADRLGPGAGSLDLVNADMRDFSLDTTFDLAIIPFRGFLALLTVEDQRRALLNIRRHLNIGGRLVFNIFVPDIQMLLQVGDTPYHLRDVTDPEADITYVLWQQSSYDIHEQIIDVRISIEELDDHRAVVKKFYRDFQLRYAFRWEVYHLLASCGFEIVDLYGDFDRTPFDETSGEMVWVARLP
ncbi:MAG: class I SAM-dependent methyltransferase [SAR202 cluster bacterium]|nr:class I SAM-dependent methyltransferase [SAR202 cluster bacterium]MDP6512577.1 class I SAM-dependent methyltransferase [SAR202 cluster bacterium]MDP6714630.1 class I SAM-dependent methyltransferase [SAR202 cluster bacterium]